MEITYPTRGWEYLYMEDTMEDEDYDAPLTETCDYCGTLLRYKHYIEHPEGLVIGVGAQCCDRLTQQYNATTNEAEAKRDRQRIRTLINSPRWTQRKNGSFITYRDYKIIIWQNPENFCLQVQAWGWNGWYYCHRSYHNEFNNAVRAGYYFIKKQNNS